MATVVLDFDSTLIPFESLELALARAPAMDAASLDEIATITLRGMEGEIGFRASLEARLAIARPTRSDLVELGVELAGRMTKGASELVAGLHAAGHEVWIVSGAFREVLLPPGRALGIAEDRIQGVTARWDAGGTFDGLLPEDGFGTSKVEGVRGLGVSWSRPAVGVGDGATDHALLEAGLVDTFVAYVEHARRRAVLAKGVPAVESMEALGSLLEDLLP